MDILRINKMWMGKSGEPPHPALWHMLDVAAVAETIVEHRPLCDSESFHDALVALIALHDLGKVSPQFKTLLETGNSIDPYLPHWRITGHYFEAFSAELEAYLNVGKDIIDFITRPVICHHGTFKVPWPEISKDAQAVTAESQNDAKIIFDQIKALFPSASLNAGMTHAELFKLSWQLSGLVVQSDWIGSNTKWFPSAATDIPVTQYWERAQEQARRAVKEAGLFQAKPSPLPANEILHPSHSLRPMQHAAMDIPLGKEPALYIMEDMTGSGKTEAALMLAKRLIDAGKGQGVFFALPTMATSNAIFERMLSAVPKLMSGSPKFALSHSKAQMNATFKALRRGHDTDSSSITPWLADNRRLVLFSDIAVGTIDQALIGVLNNKFNTLRQWALSNKVLIIDEAHSYDPYMERQLKQLIDFHYHYGGSAILMTATLPNALRASYGEPYAPASKVDAIKNSTAYPQILRIGSEVEIRPVDPVPENRRTVAVKRINSTQNALRYIHERVGQGASTVWIRNAVDDAIDAYEMLKSQGLDVTLLHARFAMGDRLDKELELTRAFGHQTDGPRAGRVVVATQVIEQSLDVDFDAMLSDVAPMGSLIQRAGRLWRHRTRPTELRGVCAAELAVLCPDPAQVTKGDWTQSVMPNGVWVYNQAELWRTAKTLFEVGQIQEPEGLRHLIETAHDLSTALPASLQATQNDQEGQVIAQKSAASCNIVKFQDGLQQMENRDPDHEPSTRLGIPQKTLYLARRIGEGLVPYCANWLLSEVKIAERKVPEGCFSQSSPAIAAVKNHWPTAMAACDIVEVDPTGRINDQFAYDPERGLCTTRS